MLFKVLSIGCFHPLVNGDEAILKSGQWAVGSGQEVEELSVIGYRLSGKGETRVFPTNRHESTRIFHAADRGMESSPRLRR